MPDRTADIPKQRADDEQVKPKRVKTTYVCCIVVNESIVRHQWRGKTEAEIIESFEKDSFDDKVQELIDELDSTPRDKMTFVRYVEIVDPD